MPIKNENATAKKQLADLLMQVPAGNNTITDLIESLDDKKIKQILLRLVKDIQDEHWSSTGAQQTIQATINIEVVQPNG
jgi:hypothetical protein